MQKMAMMRKKMRNLNLSGRQKTTRQMGSRKREEIFS
jgi:hypothetical protein